MPQTPEIVGYNPFQKVNEITQSGDELSGIIGEARQAEMALQKQRLAQKGAAYLHDVINKRIQETGNPDIGFAPFIDPVVNRAASMVEPISRDYVDLMRNIHDKNLKLIEPQNVPGGYIKYGAQKDAQGNVVTDERGLPKYDYQFNATEPEKIEIRDHIENVNGVPTIMRDYVAPRLQKTLKTEPVGQAMSPSGGSGSPTVQVNVAKLKGKLAEVNKTITEFEANEKLSSKYDAIVSDPDYEKAVTSGDIDMVSAIVSRLTGDTTPQKVNTKLFFDYINARRDEANVLAQLESYHVDTSKLKRQSKGADGKPKKKAGGF